MTHRTDGEPGRRCHTFQGFHIPGCWGCAVYDHRQCTCGPRVGSHEPAVMRADPMERRIASLERMVSAMARLLEDAAGRRSEQEDRT